MDTSSNGAPTGDTRQAASAVAATPDTRQAAADNRDKRYSRAEVAALLELSTSALRRLQTRSHVAGERERRANGGEAVTFSTADLETLRQARQAAGATPGNRPAPVAAGGDTRQAAGATGAADPAEGWRAALATVEAERDRLRSELQQAHVALQQARQHAEEAERGRHHAAEALATLRAHVAVWYAGLVRPWWRLRALPPLPPAVTSSAPALAKPEG